MSARYRFEVAAIVDAQTLPRLINHFAQRNMTPSFVQAQVAGATATVLIEQPALGHAEAAIIAEKMRASLLVKAVVIRTLSVEVNDPSAAAAGQLPGVERPKCAGATPR